MSELDSKLQKHCFITDVNWGNILRSEIKHYNLRKEKCKLY